MYEVNVIHVWGKCNSFNSLLIHNLCSAELDVWYPNTGLFKKQKTKHMELCDGSGNCTDGCVDGYWGPACESQCPANCDEPTCDSTTGHCISCKSSFWGNTCNLQCPIHCTESVCDKSNSNCTQGCTSGRYGDICNRTCSLGCVGGTCDKQSATCSSGCVQNWTGSQCDGKIHNDKQSKRIGYICFFL